MIVVVTLVVANLALITGALFGRGVKRFICRRLLIGELTLLTVSLIVFTATQLLPGDVAQRILGRDATPERVDALRVKLGTDRPFFTQYADWLGNMVTGDLGVSYVTNLELVEYIVDRIVNSLFLLLIASLLSIPISLAIGAFTARKRDTTVDAATTNSLLVLASLPEFVIGLALVILFAIGVFDWLPAVVQLGTGERPWDQLNQMILPTITLALGAIPYISRITRISLIEVLESDYVEMAQLKGATERTVIWRHAMPNALGPVFQVIALNVAYFAAGVIVVEYLFNYPGIGGGLNAAVGARDVQTVQLLAMVLATVYVLTNLAADVATVLVTPRLRTRVS